MACFALLATALGLFLPLQTQTPDLHALAARGDLDKLRIAVQDPSCLPAVLNHPNQDGQTPLHVAVDNNRSKIVALLLDAGASCNTKDTRGRTPLHLAEVFGDPSIVTPLLEFGADVTLTDRNGDTAMHIAARNGSLDAVRLILDKGAALEARNREDATPIVVARRARRGQPKTVENFLLERGAKPELYPSTFAAYHDLHAALVAHDVATAQRILQEHPNLSYEKSEVGYNALHFVSTACYPGLVHFLLEHGADPTLETDEGITALEMACETAEKPLPADRERIHQLLKEVLSAQQPPATPKKP